MFYGDFMNLNFCLKCSALALSLTSIISCCTIRRDNDECLRETQNLNMIAKAQTIKFKADCETLGFNVGESWNPVYASNGTFYHYEYSYVEANKINHTTEVDEVMLQNINSASDYAFIFRVGVSPKQCRDWGVLGVNSNSDNWYFRSLETECYLRSNEELKNFAPTNALISGSTSLSIGANKDGLNLSCGISYNFSELEIISKCDLGDDLYSVGYYDNMISNYTKYAAYYYGMFTFTCSSVPRIDISHTIKYYGTDWYHENSDEGTVRFSHTF